MHGDIPSFTKSVLSASTEFKIMKLSYSLYNRNPGVDADISDSYCGSLAYDWDHVALWNKDLQLVDWEESSFERDDGFLIHSYPESDELIGTRYLPLNV